MSKRSWYGRPNRPPLNWETPDKPVIRRVRTWLDDDIDSDAVSIDPKHVAVTLKVRDWIAILQLIRSYSTSEGNEQFKQWRLQVRKAILGSVNPFISDPTAAVEVRLEADDYRRIWRYLQVICKKRGKDWLKWFAWLSQTMTEQIKGDG